MTNTFSDGRAKLQLVNCFRDTWTSPQPVKPTSASSRRVVPCFDHSDVSILLPWRGWVSLSFHTPSQIQSHMFNGTHLYIYLRSYNSVKSVASLAEQRLSDTQTSGICVVPNIQTSLVCEIFLWALGLSHSSTFLPLVVLREDRQQQARCGVPVWGEEGKGSRWGVFMEEVQTGLLSVGRLLMWEPSTTANCFYPQVTFICFFPQRSLWYRLSSWVIIICHIVVQKRGVCINTTLSDVSCWGFILSLS